ncbi:MAG: hypothetical protein HY927_05495 [Elusimicrobia bacterium]|nr:hypothetical protein [Elusimicrobiota bacterium]
MPRCDLTIEFDQGKRSFAPGDAIRGLIRVRVEADADCKALKLACAWRTHGKGNVDKGLVQETVLYEGTWQAGEDRVYPFSIAVPRGPATYHGHLVNVDWYLGVRADIPWAIDPKAEEEILVSWPEGERSPDLGPAFSAPAARRPINEAHAFVVAKVLLLLGLVGGGGLLWEAYRSLGGKNVSGAVQYGIMGLSLAGVSLGVAYLLARNVLAQRTLGPVRFEVPRQYARRGEQFAASLGFNPVAPADMTKAVLKLKCKEEAVSGGGTNATTHTHPLGEWVLAEEPRRDLAPGMGVSLAGRVLIPADAAATFASSDNRVIWSVEAEIRLAGKPDWKKEVRIAVLP